ncbi:MAG: carboxypeptidase regulatory-like domain-containing protein, partial [Terriglobales bacterium]
GIGYFEHRGLVRGNQDVSVDFNSSQLNDVLSTLTVLDLGQGRVSGVSFNSAAPLATQLANLKLALGENVSLQDFLTALRGARVEVRQGGVSMTGRVLAVDLRDLIFPNRTEHASELSIVGDNGEVHMFEVNNALNVRIAEPDLHADVSRYLATLNSAKSQNQRRMTVSTTGSGARDLVVSYLSEVPVWKSTYRIVIPNVKELTRGEKPLLQGWAVVDNTVGEDWTNVQLSLIAGAPQSFIQPLSQPMYLRRPTVPLPTVGQLNPQTHEGALVIGGDVREVAAESGARGNLGGVVVDSSGAVITSAKVTVSGPAGSKSDFTNQDGQFLFPLLPPGYYSLKVESGSFKTTESKNVEVASGRTSNLRMAMQAGAAGEIVEVAGNAITVDTTSTAIAANTSDTYYESSPVARGTAGMFYAAPGVARSTFEAQYGKSTGGTVQMQTKSGGGSGLQNNYSADGVSVTSGGFGGTGAYSRTYGPGATAASLGDLFEYKLSQPVTILKNQSALVPIMNSHIDGTVVTVWNPGRNVPLRAVYLTNTSGLTLDDGSFTVLEGGEFAGQGLISHVKPGEKRLVSYAADLGLHVSSDFDMTETPHTVTRVSIKKGLMTMISEDRETRVYTVRNDDDKDKTIVIEHPARPGWKFVDKSNQPTETTETLHRFMVTAAAKKTVKLKVEEFHPNSTQYALSSFTPDQIDLWLSRKDRSPELESSLRPIYLKKTELSSIDSSISQAEEDLERIGNDQARVRQNLQSLKGSAEERSLVERYVKQLNQQEDDVQKLHTSIDDLQAKRSKADNELSELVDKLDMETTF